MSDAIPGDLRRLLDGLWPGAVLSSPPNTRQETKYAVLPGWGEPRLFIPFDSAASAARGMLDFSDAIGPAPAVKRLGAAGGLRVGAAKLIRTRLAIAGGEAIEDRLARIVGEPVRLVVGIGTKRANRKPVIRVMSSSGHLIAVAKLGTTPLTADLVTREHEALQHLAARSFTRLMVPRTIAMEDWHGAPLLVMTSLPTRPRAPWRRSEPPVAAMEELAASFPGRTTTLAASAFLNNLNDQASSCPDECVAAALRQLLTAVREADDNHVLETGAWHGDFTAWNMCRRGERWAVWDWEQFTLEVPIGLDLVHFVVNQSTSSRGMTMDAVTAGLVAAARVLPEEASHTLCLAYLSAIAIRYSVGFARSGDVGLGRAATIMRESLTRIIGSRP